MSLLWSAVEWCAEVLLWVGAVLGLWTIVRYAIEESETTVLGSFGKRRPYGYDIAERMHHPTASNSVRLIEPGYPPYDWEQEL